MFWVAKNFDVLLPCHFSFPEPDLKISKTVFWFIKQSQLFPEELFCSWPKAACAQFIVKIDWATRPGTHTVSFGMRLRCVSALSESRGKYCRMSGHAQNQKCLRRSQRKWGNSVALLMAESWQRICFIYPICIKVDVAITTAGRS